MNKGLAEVVLIPVLLATLFSLAAVFHLIHPYFICNQDQVNKKLKALTKTRTSEDGWTHFYRDPQTGEEWLYTTYKSELQGGGTPVLKRLPPPTIAELIDIALSSMDKDDIVGASLELCERERYNEEDFRAELLKRLLLINISALTEFEKERLRLIIFESDLYDGTNRRNIVGKHLSEIRQDADYYWSIATEAKKMLAEIKKGSS